MTAAGGVAYTYDNNGNQTGRGSDVFGWDVEDRLTSATVNGNAVTYAYRGDDLRHSKTTGGVTTVFTWDLAAELPVVLQEGTTTYVYGLGIISQTTGTATSYPLADGLGSTAALTDASGAVTATYKYDVFGAVRSSSGPGSTNFRFAGQQDDPTLGYQYLRARYYDPSIGRFISKDPFPGIFENPQTQTTYPYVQNNPISLVDPSGQIAENSRGGPYSVPSDAISQTIMNCVDRLTSLVDTEKIYENRHDIINFGVALGGAAAVACVLSVVCGLTVAGAVVAGLAIGAAGLSTHVLSEPKENRQNSEFVKVTILSTGEKLFAGAACGYYGGRGCGLLLILGPKSGRPLSYPV